MAIVKATTADYAEIVEVWEAAVRATHSFLTEKDIRFFKPLILNEYLAAVSLYCVKDDPGSIQGFLGVAEGNLEMLFIHPEHMGQGLGGQLVRFAVDELGATKVDVNEQNPAAVGFYEHMGFRVVSRSEVDGMGKPFPLLHMSL